jgi:type II secretory ATPase GspE/PulE/Tfp pilus assembly ATPase PilB-like protein
MSEDDAVIHFWENIVDQALHKKASDIHIEPDSGVSHIRLRVDGHLSHLASSPAQWHERISSRIKILARLDISEKRLPQDGQMIVNNDKNQPVDCRVSTLPTLHGEKIVCRLLHREEENLRLDRLGFQSNQFLQLKSALDQPQGFILVTGPTGSGKTQTLYTCLKYLLDGSKNISSIEDPIEIQLKGINQVQVNEKTGLRFDVALRALMRQDPDVIMLGEIRDNETAEVAFQAAQTGHLVLATLHANDAPSALWRLRQLGVANNNLSNDLLCITAQRLVRLTCKECGGASNLCIHCDSKGFKGRTAVHQIMTLTPSIKSHIDLNASLSEIKEQCKKENMLSLQESAQLLIESGVTSPQEVQRQIS